MPPTEPWKPLPLPAKRHVERALGIDIVAELHGGFQSRVFRAERASTAPESAVALKLTDGRDVELADFMNRLRVVGELAERDDHVVAPLELGGHVVHRFGDWLAVGYPLIEGRPPELSNRSDVERMGRALARLHQSLALVTAELPTVATLRVVPDPPAVAATYQLIHGDYSAANLVVDANNRLWILDFDDCGYGSVDFELGNSLFTVRFDALLRGEELRGGYLDFRHWFVGAYNAAATASISESAIEDALRTRRWALRYWLDHLETAPPALRHSTPEWRERLRELTAPLGPE